MPFTLRLTNGNHIAILADNEDAGSSEYVFASNTDVFLGLLQAALGQSEGQSLTLSGDSTAFGENTLADLSIAAAVIGGDGVVIADASVEAVAAALSSIGTAFAGANAAIDFTGAEGHALYIAHTSSASWSEDDLSLALATASASLIVIDAGPPPAPQQAGTAADAMASGVGDDPVQPTQCGCEDDVALLLNLDGNVASFSIDVSAFGSDTVVDANVDAIVVANEFSTVVALVSAAIA